MSKTCAVEGCRTNNRTRKKQGLPPKQFYRIPAVKKTLVNENLKDRAIRRRRLWEQRLFGDNSSKPYSDLRICEDHFISGKPSPLLEENHPDWAPSQRLSNFVPDFAITQQTLAEYMAQKTAKTAGADEDLALTTPEQGVMDDPEDIGAENFSSNFPEHVGEVGRESYSEDEEEVYYDACAGDADCVHVGTQTTRNLKDCWTQVKRSHLQRSIGVQTDLRMSDISRTDKLLNEAQKKLNVLELSEDAYKDDEVTRFYTALPNYCALMVIYKLVAPYLPCTPRNALTKFQQLALTLMKLRLNLYFKDLAFRFGVSRYTACRTFHRCIEVMHCRLHRSIFWPEREVIRSTMPECFKEAFGNSITVVIDCFEIFIEKASNQTAQSQTWSNYKHHQTIKFLIGITPQGFVCFISDAFGGKSTDKYITEHSKFLSFLNPGDVVMADRGFLIEDSVRFRLAKVVMPAFTRGLEQLSPDDVRNTRAIANVRIHVERVIGQLRQKFMIMSSKLPITLLNNEDKQDKVSISEIATVCCGLMNFCDTIVLSDN